MDAQPGDSTAFVPGSLGRPKSSRNEIGADFLQALHDDCVEHGVCVIARVRQEIRQPIARPWQR